MSAIDFELVDLGPSSAPVPVEGVPGAFVIPDFLSADECEQLIAACERSGFSAAPITTSSGPVYRRDLRNNDRVMFECDPEALGRLAKRLSNALPPRICCSVLDEDAPLNTRLRVYRYSRGQKFSPHFDGAFQRSSNCASRVTILVYLNEGFEGGATTFYPDGRLGFDSAPNRVEPVDVFPATGKCLLFHHGSSPLSPFHQGTPHVSDDMYKYVLRTDGMYVDSDDGFEWP